MLDRHPEQRIGEPVRAWGDLSGPGHSVQFYRSEDELLEGLRGFIGAALLAGDAGLIIATAGHRQALAERLQSWGFDLERASGQHRYIALDARETLSKFVVGGAPNAARFFDFTSDLIHRTAEPARGMRRRKIAVFGEMVALLHEDGETEAALQLEELWNALLDVYPFHLHCAYPAVKFDKDRDAALLQRIEAQHVRVVSDAA